MVKRSRSELLMASMTFQKLELFSRVATLRSVTKAAEELGLAQPAVTAQIRGMERHLRVSLVYRRGRNLELTEAGHHFHRWCEDTLHRCSELSRTFSSATDGSLGHAVVAASMTAGTYRLSEWLIRYRQDNPHITLTLRLGNTHFATEAVRTGVCDFAVLLLDPQQDLKGLELELLWDEPLLLIGSPEMARGIVMATPEIIATQPFVAAPSQILRRTLEDGLLYSAGILNRHVVIELEHPEVLKRAVKKGLGLTFMEESAVVEEIASGELCIVPTSFAHLRMSVYFAKRKDKILSAMQLRLKDFVSAEALHVRTLRAKPASAALMATG